MSTPETAIDNNKQRAEPEFVDINDPSFVDGELPEFDDQKDPLAFSIVRDGVYNVEVDFFEQDTAKHWTQRDGDRGKYLSTRLAARILDGPSANRVIIDGFVSTMVFDGTTKVAKVIKACGGDVRGATSSVEQARRLSQLLPARARVRVKVAAQEEDVKKPFYKNEKQFPEKDDGTPDFEKVMNSEGPEHGGQVFVRSEVAGYMTAE
jgi:hypothetical protein